MSGNTTRSKTPSPEQRHEVQAQEIGRLRAQLRDQAQTASQEARAEIRVRYRFAIAGLTLTALLIGGLIGRFGFPREAGASTATMPAQVQIPEEAHGDRAGDLTGFPTPWPVRVYVSGAVAEAQVVELPAGSLVADAIEAAGGPSPDADLDALNLAAPVGDNQHLSVPRLRSQATAGAALPAESEITLPIDINRASCDELAALPYIGETKAAAIVEYRTAHGAFAHIEQIQEVPGIGPATFEHIAELITVGP